MEMKLTLLVGLGGFIGTVMRYLAGQWVTLNFSQSGLGTLLVNSLGSFIIGFVYGISAEKLSPELSAIIAVGILGGFTTFSAFSLDTILYFKEGRYLMAAAYVGVMILVGLLATYLGISLSKLYLKI
jgi:fluoride exporter